MVSNNFAATFETQVHCDCCHSHSAVRYLVLLDHSIVGGRINKRVLRISGLGRDCGYGAESDDLDVHGEKELM